MALADRTAMRWAASAVFVALLQGCVSRPVQLEPPPAHANGLALWRILHDGCVPGQRLKDDPAPCALVDLSPDEAHGFVVLKDRVGVAQHLLMPTSRITGIEDRAVYANDAANYFALAWEARSLVEARLGGRLPRDQVSIAVNSAYGRSQDQLHLHVDCLAFSVRDSLKARSSAAPGVWSRRPVMLAGHAYRVMRLNGETLGAANPFKLLVARLPTAARDAAAWTLVLAGAQAPDGAPGFFLLAARADPRKGDFGSGEELQDHDCVGQRADLARRQPG